MAVNNKQRATKQEKKMAEAVLFSLFKKAYLEGNVEVDYSNKGKEGPEQARLLHQALKDYRRKVIAKQTEMFETFMILRACTLRLEAGIKVIIDKKTGAVSERTQIILDVIADNPELELDNPLETSIGLNPIHAMTKNFEN